MENANEAIYIGIFTFIFVIALSLTVFLFSQMMGYTDEAYDYMHAASNDSLIVNQSANRNLIISAQDVLSYYFNYVKKDNISENIVDDSVVVSINLNTKDESPNYLDNTSLSYKDALEKIGADNKYILTVDSRTNENTTYLNITKATQEELQEEW